MQHMGNNRNPNMTHEHLYNQEFRMKQDKICKGNIMRNENRSITKETEISKHVIDYFHVRSPDLVAFNSYVVIIHHPVDRMVSWFHFEHPKNSNSKRWRKEAKLYNCYNTVNELAHDGLSAITGQNSSTCQIHAHKCIRGENIFCEHMFYNYEFFVQGLLSMQKEIFVV